MLKFKKLNLPVIFRIPVLAYLMMSTVTFLWSSVDRNYFNIELITLNEFYIQLFGFILLTGLLFLFYKKYDKKLLSLCICFLLLLYIFIFEIDAPALSLMIGTVIFAIPALYFSLNYVLKHRKNLLTTRNIIALINLLLFLVIVLYFVFNVNTIFPAISVINISKVSHDSFLYGNRFDFLYLSIAILPFIFLIFLMSNNNKILLNHKKIKYALSIIVIVLCIFEVVFMSRIAINHVRSLYTPTYDFAIFAQMFYNIRDGVGAVTTLERSRLLSHFSVHMSPIVYVLTPIFVIFPFPETVQALQIIIVGCGLIPLYFIIKELKLNRVVGAVLLLVYIFHPAIIGSSFYDFHENCFLAPMLLTVIYFLMKQKWIFLGISVILTLMIKEDASIYLIFISLYFIFGFPKIMKQDKSQLLNTIVSISIIVLSLVYFLLITRYLNTEGDGAMFWRYDNLNAYTEYGAFGIIMSVFQNPSFLLATMFSPEKIYTILIVFLFMGGIPLLSRNLANYWLIAPFVVFNLASTYLYQNLIGFQYFYGSITILIFMMAITFKQRTNATTMNLDFKKYNYIIYAFAVVLIAVFGISFMYTKNYINDDYQNNLERNIVMKESLLSIGENNRVLATGYLTTYLADVDVIYDIQYYNLSSSDIEFDYIILDLRVNPDRVEIYKIEILNNDYVLSDQSNQYLMIFEPSD